RWPRDWSSDVCSSDLDCLMSRAMKHMGSPIELWRKAGVWSVMRRMASSLEIWVAVAFMSVAFFTLLFALSWADVSLVVPAAASLTFVTNALAAKIFLHENVDRRGWAATILVCCGVGLLAGT